MINGEFDLIQTFFAQHRSTRRDVALAIGDDCALTQVPADKLLAITTDTMVENSHFYPDINPRDLGYKAIATNLSDLAAMGAQPAWVSLALTLADIDEPWLREFSQGVFELLDQYQIALIGGDTTSGKLRSITVTAQGFVDKSTALRRDQAQVGDWIYVSGNLGDALAGFYLLQQQQQQKKEQPQQESAVDFEQSFLIQRNLRPTPRIELGLALAQQQFSRCALDLSDGLVGDLAHILRASGVSAVINLQDLPCSAALVKLYGRAQAERLALQGGEDYELCFTIAPDQQARFEQYAAQQGWTCYCIGRAVPAQNRSEIYYQRHNQPVSLQLSSFEHFK